MAPRLSREPERRDPSRASQLAQRRRARRQTALTITAVFVLAAAGGYALLATKATKVSASGRLSAAGETRGPSQSQPAVPVAAPSKSQPELTITWVGDMNFGTLGQYPPGGAASLIGGVSRDLRSDLTLGNLETALGSGPLTKCAKNEANCYAFEAPPAAAQALAQAGFGAVNVANNHTMDAGPSGEQSTDAALRAAGLAWAGRPGQITYLVRNGVKVALLGFATWPYDASMLDIPAAQALVRQAKKHAQIVIVMMHAGGEGAAYQHVRPGEEYFLGEDRGNAIAFTHAVIDAGADLVVGSGPHVLRGMQWYRGHLIAYSLGNFCDYYTFALNGVTADSAILHVTLRADGSFAGGRITPLVLTQPGIPRPDPAGTAIGLVNSLSRDDFGGNGAVSISARGVIGPP